MGWGGKHIGMALPQKRCPGRLEVESQGSGVTGQGTFQFPLWCPLVALFPYCLPLFSEAICFSPGLLCFSLLVSKSKC